MTWLIDFKGYSLRTAPPVRTQIQTTQMLQNHYPERLGLAVCYHAPRLFSMAYKVSPTLKICWPARPGHVLAAQRKWRMHCCTRAGRLHVLRRSTRSLAPSGGVASLLSQLIAACEAVGMLCCARMGVHACCLRSQAATFKPALSLDLVHGALGLCSAAGWTLARGHSMVLRPHPTTDSADQRPQTARTDKLSPPCMHCSCM